jgi:hypothetical protein
MTQVILVEGTWGGQWARARSPFSKMLAENGFAPMRFQGWTTNVSGVPNLFASRKHSDWIAGGYALAPFLRELDYEDRNLIAHSHGLNPIAYACAREKVEIRRLVSVCSPVRRDMRNQMKALALRVEQWLHVHAAHADLMQTLGALFSGHLALRRDWRVAGAENVTNLMIPGIGHSRLLNDPTQFAAWRDCGLLDFLRGA